MKIKKIGFIDNTCFSALGAWVQLRIVYKDSYREFEVGRGIRYSIFHFLKWSKIVRVRGKYLQWVIDVNGEIIQDQTPFYEFFIK